MFFLEWFLLQHTVSHRELELLSPVRKSYMLLTYSTTLFFRIGITGKLIPESGELQFIKPQYSCIEFNFHFSFISILAI